LTVIKSGPVGYPEPFGTGDPGASPRLSVGLAGVDVALD
jgi:hypothetical protein